MLVFPVAGSNLSFAEQRKTGKYLSHCWISSVRSILLLYTKVIFYVLCNVSFIKMDLQEVGGGRGDWMELAQDRDRWRALVGTVRDFRVP